MRRLLLLSNSRDAQGRYLVHARDALASHLAGVPRVAFIPFAGMPATWDDYATRVRDAFAPLGVAVDSVHESDDPAALVRTADAIAVGGGNTFHLLALLQRSGLLADIRHAAQSGVPYVGWSAGSVVACPTLGTTNDMPIVQPDSFDALGLVRFQVNAHFTDAHPPGFQGETRRQRIDEFLAVNRETAVIGLPEGDWLEVQGATVTLRGEHPAPVFSSSTPAATAHPGESVETLLEGMHSGAPPASGAVALHPGES